MTSRQDEARRGVGAGLSKLLDRQEVVEFMIAVQLYALRIHEIVRRRYELRYGSALLSGERRSVASNQVDASGFLDDISEHEVEIPRAINGARPSGGPGAKPLEEPHDQGQHHRLERPWDWRYMPHLPRVFIHYEVFTNIYMVVILIKNLFPSQLQALFEWLFNPALPARCYLLGNIVAHQSIEQHVGMLFALYQIVWRTTIWYYQRPYFLSLYVFLAMTDRDLDRFYKMIEAQSEPQSAHHTSSASAKNRPIGDYQGLYVNTTLDARVTKLFARSLCYPVKVGARIHYRLKPNRTPEARHLLRRHLSKTLLIYLAGFMMLAVAVIALMCSQLFEVRRYLRLYGACNARPDQLQTANRWQEISPPRTAHYYVSFSMDLLENFVLWFETGYTALFCWIATYLLNHDTELYWKRMDARLKRLHHLMRAEYLMRGQKSPPESEQRQLVLWEENELDSNKLLPPQDQHRRRMSLGVGDFQSESQKLQDRCLLMEIQRQLGDFKRVLKVECYSFFEHMKQVDMIASDVISSSFFVCITIFAVFGQVGAAHLRSKDSDPILVGIIVACEMFIFTIVTIGSLIILRLQVLCRQSYKTICSLVAYDMSVRKDDFLNLLEFFNTSRCAYTVLHHYSFTKTAFLSIFGWSFSCFFIINGFGRRS